MSRSLVSAYESLYLRDGVCGVLLLSNARLARVSRPKNLAII